MLGPAPHSAQFLLAEHAFISNASVAHASETFCVNRLLNLPLDVVQHCSSVGAGNRPRCCTDARSAIRKCPELEFIDVSRNNRSGY